ncbi:ATP cone domain-containing protein, partial [Candidatus Pyrohabitans sp.]
MYVLKASGKREKFNPKKLERTLYRAGATKDAVNAIITQVQREVYDGITTREVYNRVLELLDKHQPAVSPCYDLKQAIMRLGPAGFPFETYLSQILREYGYRTRLRTKLKGRCVTHEIDIIAEREEKGRVVRSLIEVKFHNTSGTYISLKEALYTYARFLDLNHTRNNFDEVWLSCNTRASPDAKAYARCMGVKLLCWGYPPKRSLEKLIDRKKLYPITALRNIDPGTVNAFSRAGYMLIKDLLVEDYSRLKTKTGLPSDKLK